MANKSKKSISLILGSGGARGLAHIGVIECLEEKGYSIDSICGCSMGALIGGMYAAGKLNEYKNWVSAVSKADILMLLDVSFGQAGLVKGDRVINTLKGLVGDRRIEDLPVAFTAVASDIVNEKEVWLNRGPLFDAIRASIAIPLFFTPVDHHGVMLLDGGILNPVPIAPTFKDATDFKIAVNLSGSSRPFKPAPPPKAERRKEHSPFESAIRRFIEKARESMPGVKSESFGMLDIASQSIEAMQGTIARQKLAAYPPDITIEIPRNLCGTLEFHRAQELIREGHRLAAETLAQLD